MVQPLQQSRKLNTKGQCLYTNWALFSILNLFDIYSKLKNSEVFKN